MNLENDVTQEIAKSLTGEIMDHVYAGIIITDLNGEILVFNQTAEQIFGFSKHEAIGRNVSQFIKKKQNPECHSAMKQFSMETTEPAGCQVCNANGVNRHGAHVPLHITISPMSFDNRIMFINAPEVAKPPVGIH
ncbi:MAG: PAS domain S-box protein [Gammaproteobacteria bacterium]|nr:PAS domain S-box protein [Gammaproteobacteria bacterium]MDH5594214.1 PAS domain S-box protein [Gammaproteobacteria bacterium]MDH5614768.1 PAS domain S-box protein [Gammaproteobacteria bacterium]